MLPLDILADAPWTLHLDMPFSAEELRTTPLTESTAHRLALDVLAAFLDRARQHIKEGAHDGIVLGREYGFTLVPMQAAYREEIRRMAELTAFVTRHADTYDIFFSGGASLSIKAPPPPAQESTEDAPICWCYECNKERKVHGLPYASTRMILCPECGNKRCPHATDHTLSCTGSNEPGQPGSRY